MKELAKCELCKKICHEDFTEIASVKTTLLDQELRVCENCIQQAERNSKVKTEKELLIEALNSGEARIK
jgi:hypothetical protein